MFSNTFVLSVGIFIYFLSKFKPFDFLKCENYILLWMEEVSINFKILFIYSNTHLNKKITYLGLQTICFADLRVQTSTSQNGSPNVAHLIALPIAVFHLFFIPNMCIFYLSGAFCPSAKLLHLHGARRIVFTRRFVCTLSPARSLPLRRAAHGGL